MNWGYKILVVLVLFFIMIFSFLFIAMKQTNEMLETNYYDKEIKFQKILNGAENLNQLSEKLDIQILKEYIEIQLPTEGIKDQPSIHVELIKMSDESKDFTVDQQADDQGKLKIPSGKFTPGYYRIQIQWESGGKPFVFRDQIKFALP